MYTVLIVDDEVLICDGVKAKLERAGIPEIDAIHTAYGGLQGLQSARAIMPHIVITDIRMPDMDGISLIKELAASLPRTKFIMLSGYDDYAYVREAFKYGAIDYLLKPAGSAELAKQVQTAIAAIEEHSLLARRDERNRQDEQTLLAARLNMLLNGSVRLHTDSDPAEHRSRHSMDSGPNPPLEAYFLHARFAVSLLAINDNPFNGNDLKRSNACFEHLVQEAGIHNQLRFLAFHNMQGAVSVIFNFTEHVPLDLVVTLLGNATMQLGTHAQARPAASISGLGERLSELPGLYKQAVHAMSYRILREPSEVLRFAEPIRRHESALPDRKDIEELRQAVDTLRLERIGDWIDRWFDDNRRSSISLEQLKALYDLLMTEIHRHVNGRLLFEESEQAHAFGTFHSLSDLRHYLKGYAFNAKQIVMERSSHDGTVIAVAESIVREQYSRDLQLAEVANRVSMNYSYFSKLFKERTGLTFTSYLIKIRMEEAQKLLKNPTLRINEISEMVGYGNLYHFSRAFKNYFGVSPKEHRKTMQ
ncbi:response regulator [Paenibacillus sp. MBLB4367]|uniref:response regulator n=1 Tax=Paenibacillus sp. MBLB4367 TaxID=3384767 RepID=UPI0039083343